jgi:hypothetical protein
MHAWPLDPSIPSHAINQLDVCFFQVGVSVLLMQIGSKYNTNNRGGSPSFLDDEGEHR